MPVLNPVGTVNGTTYQAFTISRPAGAVSPAVFSETGKQRIIANTQNTLKIGTINLNPFGNIVASSGAAFFNLHSFYFGCVVNDANSAATSAQGCVISVTGFTLAGKQVPVATFSFAPTAALNQHMVQALLPSSYANLLNVTVSSAKGNPSPGFPGQAWRYI